MMKQIYYLIAIIFIATVLRFWGLETLSPPLNRDEAAIAYNAYSLLLTGKDEHGQPWPSSFKSIGDYKMPGYIYLSMIPIKFIGLTIFATRFWSALAGVLAVIFLYLIVKELKLFKDKQQQIGFSLLAAFILAINPWHLHFSRIGFEANVNLTLFIFGLLALLKGLSKSWWFIVASFSFVAMTCMYSSTFIFLPVFLLGFFFMYRKQLFTQYKNPILWISIIILVFGSFLAFKSVDQVSQAKQSVTLFGDPEVIDTYNKIRFTINYQNPILAKIWYNKPFYISRLVFANYLKSFSPGFLLKNQANHPWHIIPGQGYFYILDILGTVIGLAILIYSYKQHKQITLLLVLWLLAAPLASAITIDAPHATRSLYLIPIITILAAYGFFTVVSGRHKCNIQGIRVIILIVIYLILFSKVASLYLFYFPKNYSPDLFAGINQPIAYLEKINNKRLVYFSDVDKSVYLYVLLYAKIDPSFVQTQAHWKGADTIGLSNIEYIGKYRFISELVDSQKPYYFVTNNKSNAVGLYLEKEFFDNRTTSSWYIYRN